MVDELEMEETPLPEQEPPADANPILTAEDQEPVEQDEPANE
jgi:hypothetical protein